MNSAAVYWVNISMNHELAQQTSELIKSKNFQFANVTTVMGPDWHQWCVGVARVRWPFLDHDHLHLGQKGINMAAARSEEILPPALQGALKDTGVAPFDFFVNDQKNLIKI